MPRVLLSCCAAPEPNVVFDSVLSCSSAQRLPWGDASLKAFRGRERVCNVLLCKITHNKNVVVAFWELLH